MFFENFFNPVKKILIQFLFNFVYIAETRDV